MKDCCCEPKLSRVDLSSRPLKSYHSHNWVSWTPWIKSDILAVPFTLTLARSYRWYSKTNTYATLHNEQKPWFCHLHFRKKFFYCSKNRRKIQISTDTWWISWELGAVRQGITTIGTTRVLWLAPIWRISCHG